MASKLIFGHPESKSAALADARDRRKIELAKGSLRAHLAAKLHVAEPCQHVFGRFSGEQQTCGKMPWQHGQEDWACSPSGLWARTLKHSHAALSAAMREIEGER